MENCRVHFNSKLSFRTDKAGAATVEVTLRNPLMCRKTVEDTFSPDPVNYPPDIRKELENSSQQ